MLHTGDGGGLPIGDVEPVGREEGTPSHCPHLGLEIKIYRGSLSRCGDEERKKEVRGDTGDTMIYLEYYGDNPLQWLKKELDQVSGCYISL